MKKIGTLALGLLSSASAFALPVGNPVDATLLLEGVVMHGRCYELPPSDNWCDAWSVRVGFYGDYVFNRHLKIDEHNRNGTIHQTEVMTNAGYLALNVWDRIDLFSTLGATHFSLNTSSGTFGQVEDFMFLETDTDFSWSIGVRGTLWECNCFGIGAEAQYFYTRPQLNWVQDEGDVPTYGDSGDHVKYREWQIGLGAAYSYQIISCCSSLVPYMAVKWSQVKVDLNDFFVARSNNITLPDLKNDRHFGFALGLTLVGARKLGLTIEGRFIDETALHFNAQFRF